MFSTALGKVQVVAVESKTYRLAVNPQEEMIAQGGLPYYLLLLLTAYYLLLTAYC